jgi:hypothetical protein
VVGLAPGRRSRARLAGLFLFLPLPAKLDWPRLVEAAAYPGGATIPAVNALLALLVLKLIDEERRSHGDDLNFDEAAGLFCGLNVPPKRSFMSEHSCRACRDNRRRLLLGWGRGLSGLLFAEADTFSLDFHPIPQRGEEPALERHRVSTQGRARPSVLSFFAPEQGRRAPCYADANLTRPEQAAEPLRFVDFWRGPSGRDPARLYFGSRVTAYQGPSRLNQRRVQFITIRRRGGGLVRGLREPPASAWGKAVISTPRRCHQHARHVDERVRLRGYAGQIRQAAVDGLGKEEPTPLISNNEEETARGLIIRYAGRDRVEDGLGSCVGFCHLDRLSSEVRLNADLDATLTASAHGCCRWLGGRVKGHEAFEAKQLYRHFVETGGLVEVQGDQVVVTPDGRSRNPLLREAALDRERTPAPWLRQLPARFCHS